MKIRVMVTAEVVDDADLDAIAESVRKATEGAGGSNPLVQSVHKTVVRREVPSA